jgi:pimeloyl-ACP methyl ester carboxylesterase
MTLSDGRILAWYEWGPPAGVPVLFCTGAAMSGWLGFGSDCLADLGLRLMAVDRPGLGRSSPHPHKTLASWVDDMRELLQFNALSDMLVVGFSQGAPFAFALAGSGLVSAAAIVAGQDQLDHPQIRPLLHPDVAGMLTALQQDPAGFEQQMAGMITLEGLWSLVIGMSGERDRALYESAAFGAAYRRALEQGFAQGTAGYARDLVNALGAWPTAPEAIHIPVDLWYGLEDTSTVHSPDFGATLAARLPQVTHTTLAGEGGSILWTQSHAILERLAAHRSPQSDV